MKLSSCFLLSLDLVLQRMLLFVFCGSRQETECCIILLFLLQKERDQENTNYCVFRWHIKCSWVNIAFIMIYRLCRLLWYYWANGLAWGLSSLSIYLIWLIIQSTYRTTHIGGDFIKKVLFSFHLQFEHSITCGGSKKNWIFLWTWLGDWT